MGVVFVLIATPRMLATDRFVTIDEPRWLARSANFYQALTARDPMSAYQTSHPGVTTMWMGAAGFKLRYPDYPVDHPRQLIGLESVEPFLRARGIAPMEILSTARQMAAFFIALVLLASFAITTRFMGWIGASLGFMLIAFEPLLIALSRVLHLDGLQSAFSLLAVVSLVAYLEERRAPLLLLSGLSAGLAGLTRSPAFILILFTALGLGSLTLRGWGAARWEGGVRLLGRMSLWTGGLIAAIVLVWPAARGDLVASTSKIVQAALSAAGGGHDNPIFFNGQVITGDPGLSFYPAALFWRTTPVVSLGLIMALGALFWRRRRGLWSSADAGMAWLILYSVLYVALLSLSAKKLDRYISPIMAPMGLVAAWGWLWTIEALRRSMRRATRWIASPWAPALLAVALVAIQASHSLRTHPYYFSHYNALLGGADRAPEAMMIGWGEGLDQAADYLNDKEQAGELEVISWYASGPFDYFFSGAASTLPFDMRSIEELAGYDYAVLYAHQWQRELPSPQVLSYFEQREPEAVIEIDGLSYAWIYRLP
jgi:hypothetical protein